jgi:hypothetical protein
VIRIQFPWHPHPLCRVKIEITDDEPVLLPPERYPVLHGYEETLEAQLLAYRLEEIVAEKMRTLRQTDEKLRTRGWNRARARDYYDLWRILRERGDALERERLPDLLAQKCAHRTVTYHSLDDFFTERLVAKVEANWETNLRAFIRNLPPAQEVLTQLRALLPNFFPNLAIEHKESGACLSNLQ